MRSRSSLNGIVFSILCTNYSIRVICIAKTKLSVKMTLFSYQISHYVALQMTTNIYDE